MAVNVPKKTCVMRYVAGQPVEKIFPEKIHSPSKSNVVLSDSGSLRVMVWNIFKQHRADWLSVLKEYAKNSHLVLLQEAQTTPELIHFATSCYHSADQVPAFSLPQHPSGVMTLAAALPTYCYPLCEIEPLIRLAKSSLITMYTLPDDRSLMVINIHAINFSLGIDVYSKQLRPIRMQIASHQGPVIMAGDFNAWSKQRIYALQQFAEQMQLQEVSFTHDLRRTAFGKPLDFIFYRGLDVVEASVLVTRASDHNPLLVEFHIK